VSPARPGGAPSARTRIRRIPENARYDRSAIDAILDEALVAHLGFVDGGQPYVIPTLHARVVDVVYVHGSAASRTLRRLAAGAPVCLTATVLDGLVLARSVFEHSVNYRSVVVLGTATLVAEPDEKLRALEAFSEQLVRGRWANVRHPSERELKATSILSLPLDEASAKLRNGPPSDGDSPDAELDVWAGIVPLELRALAPVPAPELRPGIPVPRYINPYRRT
jgi:uncharacterized protein